MLKTITTGLSILVLAAAMFFIFNGEGQRLWGNFAKYFRQGQSVTYEGYVIRNWEAVCFAPNSPLEDNTDDSKIWIIDSSEWEKELNWESTPNGRTEYTKVRIEGKLYGPGKYGG